jgi:hypothetical protein
MVNGVIRFPRPEECKVKNEVREMLPRSFGLGRNLRDAAAEAEELEV